MSNTFYVPTTDEVQQAKTSQAPRRKATIGGVTGELETPSGKDPFQNAWLTLTLGYGLNFLDSRIRGSAGGRRPDNRAG